MKTRILYLILTLSLGFILSGCTIKRNVKPVSINIEKEICIIENRKVKEDGFLDEYIDTLQNMGYVVKVLPYRSSINSCLITSKYTANWQWDLAMYLSYVKIDVYKDSKLVGSALYDSRNGGGRIIDKFVDGEDLVESLVKELYKNRLLTK